MPLTGAPALRPDLRLAPAAALKALHAETGEARFATVQALVRRPETAADAYVAMVEENEIRLGLSQYERARVAALAAARGVFPDEEAALRALFATASRPKRSRIRAFLALYHGLDARLALPGGDPRAARPRARRAAARGPRRRRSPRRSPRPPRRPPEAELALLARLARRRRRRGRRRAPATSPRASRSRPGSAPRRLTLTLQGRAVDPALAARVEAAIAAALRRRRAGRSRRVALTSRPPAVL